VALRPSECFVSSGSPMTHIPSRLPLLRERKLFKTRNGFKLAPHRRLLATKNPATSCGEEEPGIGGNRSLNEDSARNVILPKEEANQFANLKMSLPSILRRSFFILLVINGASQCAHALSFGHIRLWALAHIRIAANRPTSEPRSFIGRASRGSTERSER
jgi:hypothetical protein